MYGQLHQIWRQMLWRFFTACRLLALRHSPRNYREALMVGHYRHAIGLDSRNWAC